MALQVITQQTTVSRPESILFVHGAWHGAWCWGEYWMPYFAKQGYACHALDLRGHGNSPGRERLRFTGIMDYCADVAEVVGRMPRPPILIGHSMGGLVIQKYLESHTAPAAVLLASVPTHGAIKATLRAARKHPLAFLKANLTLSLYPLVNSPKLARDFFFSPDLAPDLVQRYVARLQDESYRAFLDMIVFALPRPKRVKTPMLVIGAGSDALFDPGEVQSTAQAYNTRAEIMPATAHDMMLEPRWQTPADRVLAWLKERKL